MTVTIVPTSTAMMNVRGSSVTPLVAADPKTESSALAMRMPTTNPRIDATKPGHRRLDEHRRHHLRPRRAERAQQVPAHECAARRGC